ncbi:uncharacterized protein HD556DRAFT_1532454 [Suillus plorans]|uniref:Uncharacterized protein n=1 Tax=Suillus plorans TaxID=116603 RepID=A0A9P7J6V9_9AGAM|nr:uncharacterized protein HD556DRAFT_1532454 [Suillus plorans]KAG1806283.1 hypothetical protein HD556DRAFT_1532454 [Suillus plorans]
MPSTASQLERSLRKLQISESGSQNTSTAVTWVPSKYSSDVSQKELWDMGTIAFHHVWPGETLPDNNAYIAMNSLTFLEVYLGLRLCTLAGGKVVGDSKDIPSECVTSGEVLLLVLWRDTEREATCPTRDQVYSVKMKLKRPPGWWVEIPGSGNLHQANLPGKFTASISHPRKHSVNLGEFVSTVPRTPEKLKSDILDNPDKPFKFASGTTGNLIQQHQKRLLQSDGAICMQPTILGGQQPEKSTVVPPPARPPMKQDITST